EDTEFGSFDGTAPDLSESSSEKKDITRPFFEACQTALEAGELCHNPWFSLIHSMSAIEVMDPKMDIRVQGMRHVMTTTEAVCTNALPLDPFDNRCDLVGVMDELLAATTNWLTGDSLAQSVFTCMYMHCTQLVRDPYLRVFCELLRRVIFQMRQIILAAGVFDEEDFYPPTNGMPLKGPNPAFDRFLDTQVLAKSAEFFNLTVNGLVEHTQNLINSLHTSTNGSSDVADNFVVIITSRLEFLMELLRFTDLVVSYINATEKNIRSSSAHDHGEIENHPVSDDPESTTCAGNKSFPSNDFWFNLFTMCSTIEPILKKLNHLSKTLLDTVASGLSPGEGRLFPKDHPYGLPGFEPFLKQTSLPSYIPRFVIIHDRAHAFRYLCGLIDNLLRIIQSRLLVTKWHDYDSRGSPLHLLWSVARLGGQETHSYVVQLLNTQNNSKQSTTTSECCSLLPSCLLSRALSCLLYYISMRYLRAPSMQMNVSSSLQVELILHSWLNLEVEKYRDPLRTIISDLVGLKGFFEILADHLIHIPNIYCLNRSRQRSALDQLLQKFPDLLGECWRVEWIMGIELAKKLGMSEPSAPAGCNAQSEIAADSDKPPFSVPLRLTSFVRYYYYQLAWDYLVTGFQLELYAAYEWAFVYTFLMELFQNTSALLERFTVIIDESDSDSQQPHPKPRDAHRSRRSKGMNKKKKNRRNIVPQPEDLTNNDRLPSVPLRPCGPKCDLEFGFFRWHHELVAGTIYALRALQLDSGGDIILDFPNNLGTPELKRFGNPEEIYARRLGLFLAPSGSPLSDPGGCSSAFRACKRSLTSGIFSTAAGQSNDGQPGDTTELYMMAAHHFQTAQLSVHSTQAAMSMTVLALTVTTKIHLKGDLFGQLLGTPDRLSDLEQLAKHNAIACRVLSDCRDRRPSPLRTSLPAFLSRSSPVQLDFSFLTSRTYPLIRLISPQANRNLQNT
ncbi:N-alpha-acetyltransferase 35 NatC auxiliary subunit, partial [Fasciola gigantica]